MGEKFHIDDGRPTYPGCTYEGRLASGLLFNVRVVQATFDDADPSTRHLRAYLGTGVRDARRNMPAFQEKPKPLVINEDLADTPDLEAAWDSYVSWGYFDHGFGGPDAWARDAYVDARSQPSLSQARSAIQSPSSATA